MMGSGIISSFQTHMLFSYVQVVEFSLHASTEFLFIELGVNALTPGTNN